MKFWKAVFWRTPFLRYRWQRFARDLIPSLALYTLCWVMAPTESTLLGFFEAPFKEVFFGRKKAGIFPAKKFGSYGRDLYGRENKIKKLEGQTGQNYPPGLPFPLAPDAKCKQ